MYSVRLVRYVRYQVLSLDILKPRPGSGVVRTKNRPAPFPGRMLYKATKPGLVCVLYLRML